MNDVLNFCRDFSRRSIAWDFLVKEEKEPFEDLQFLGSPRTNLDFLDTDIDLNNCTNSFPSILAGTLSTPAAAALSSKELASLTISFPRLSINASTCPRRRWRSCARKRVPFWWRRRMCS